MSYTILHRRVGARRCNLMGFYTNDIGYLERTAKEEVNSGAYVYSKVVNMRTGEVHRHYKRDTK